MPRLSDAGWAAVKVEYETSARSVREIAEAFGVSHVTVWKRAKALGWTRPDEAPELPAGEAEAALLARLFRTFERQIADLEQRFVLSAGAIEEKDARTLSVLARTFETLAKLRGERESGTEDAEVDLDALRAKLAERLATLAPRGPAGLGADVGDGGRVERG